MRTAVAGWILVLGTVPLMVGTPAESQIGSPVERDRTPADRDCVCVDDLRDRVMRQVRLATRHARLGVVLGDREEVAGRSGVRAAQVPEGSPAHRAGLREGDVLVAIDERELGAEPAAALLERLAAVTPGDTVEIGFLRQEQERTARVVTEEGNILESLGKGLRFQIPDMRRAVAREGFPIRDRRDGLRLAAVNPELGQYFGTDRGVLVTDVHEGSRLNLRPGDVVLAVGDREVRDPAHLRSILASYRDDEPVTIRIMRDRQTQQITGGP